MSGRLKPRAHHGSPAGWAGCRRGGEGVTSAQGHSDAGLGSCTLLTVPPWARGVQEGGLPVKSHVRREGSFQHSSAHWRSMTHPQRSRPGFQSWLGMGCGQQTRSLS